MESVRVVSTSPLGIDTKFFTESGSEIKGVYKYVLSCSVGRAPLLKLYIHGAKVDVVSPAQLTEPSSESAD